MYRKLLEYQEEDKKLKAIEDTYKTNEDYKKYNVAVRFLKTVSETKTQIEDRAGYLLSELDDLKVKYERLAEEQTEFEAVDEANEEATVVFLKKKSQELSKAFADIERDIDKLNAEMTELVSQYKKLSAETKAMKEQYEKSREAVAAIQKNGEGEKNEITNKLADIAKSIPAELMAKYNAARKSNKFPLVYVVEPSETKHCAACGTEFSSLESATLKKDKFIECENCRKLIFLKN
ncbi:MAG: hypothetical protein J5762_01840 [Clostridia bacterium]|nr:hypothetical protein [Clostridia bacterium]